MAEISALKDLLERVRRIVGTSKEKKLSGLLEKRRRKWRKDCRKRNVPVPKVTVKPVDAVVLERREQLSETHESSVDGLTKRRSEMRKEVFEVLQKPRLEKILDSIETRVNAVHSEGRICEPGDDDGVSNNSTAGHPNFQLLLKELSKDISSAQTIQRVKAMQLVATSTSVSSPPAEAGVTSTTSSLSLTNPLSPNTNPASSSQATSSPIPMDIGNVVEVRTSLVMPTASVTESTLLSPPSMEATSSPPVKVVVRSNPRVRRSTPKLSLPKNDVLLAAATTETPLGKVDSSTKPLVTKSNNELVRLLHEIQRVADTDDGYSKRQHTSKKR